MSEAIPSWMRPGAKIVCVNAKLSEYSETSRSHLIEGGVYTVRSTLFHERAQRPAVQLREVLANVSFDVTRFRPLVSQADDIATHFAHHLDTRAPELV